MSQTSKCQQSIRHLYTKLTPHTHTHTHKHHYDSNRARHANTASCLPHPTHPHPLCQSYSTERRPICTVDMKETEPTSGGETFTVTEWLARQLYARAFPIGFVSASLQCVPVYSVYQSTVCTSALRLYQSTVCTYQSTVCTSDVQFIMSRLYATSSFMWFGPCQKHI